jgi:5-(carboxyamino)imidazole ribonucleotide synthase
MKVAILGGGQLAAMLAESGKKIGVETLCIDPNTTCSASHVTEVIHDDLKNSQAIHQALADVACMTYETESLPYNQVRKLSKKVPVHPPIHALKITQDRFYEKQMLTSLHIPTPVYHRIRLDQLRNTVRMMGLPCVLKTRRNGYDGKGQMIIKNDEDITAATETMKNKALILEEFIPFDFEVSLICVRSVTGEIRYYPLTHNTHQNGILRQSIAPYLNKKLELEAQHHANKILSYMNYVGVMTIEFFVKDQSLIANEIAPRVHNSGHWTIEGAKTSQFENHLRAILGMPLGSTETSSFNVMINCIGKEPDNIINLLNNRHIHYHTYHKAPRENRKLAHITICSDSKEHFESEFKPLIDGMMK